MPVQRTFISSLANGDLDKALGILGLGGHAIGSQNSPKESLTVPLWDAMQNAEQRTTEVEKEKDHNRQVILLKNTESS